LTDTTRPKIKPTSGSTIQMISEACDTGDFTDPGDVRCDDTSDPSGLDVHFHFENHERDNVDWADIRDKPGTYFLVYSCTDAMGLSAAEVHRKVHITDQTPPDLNLNQFDGTGSPNAEFLFGETWTEPGWTVSDECDVGVNVSSKWDRNPLCSDGKFCFKGTFIIDYFATDTFGHSAHAQRKVTVQDASAPQIHIHGANPLVVKASLTEVYHDPGAICVDAEDGPLHRKVDISAGLVTHYVTEPDLSQPTAGGAGWSTANYQIVYTCSDSANQAATNVTREVTVLDDVNPTLTLNGHETMYIERGDEASYTAFRNDINTDSIAAKGPYEGDPWVSGTDNIDNSASLTAKCVDGDDVGCTTKTESITESVGYFSYSAKDEAGNPSNVLSRTLQVVDTIPPVIHLNLPGGTVHDGNLDPKIPTTSQSHAFMSETVKTSNGWSVGSFAVPILGIALLAIGSRYRWQQHPEIEV